MNLSVQKRNKGLSLIEVLVAMVIVALGIMGISKLQIELTRNAASTKIRTAALSLAQEKIEDLRAFARVSKPIDPVSGNTIEWSSIADPSNTANVMAFNYITSNVGTYDDGDSTNNQEQGGRLIPFSTALAGTSPYLTGSDEELFLTWEVNPVSPIGDVKQVTVTVEWNDSEGMQNVQLSQILSSINPGAASPLNGETGTDIAAPTISYTPGEAPEIINVDIDAGDALKKETSKPLPDVFHNAAYTKSTFEVVTYNNPSNTVVRREQFVNVSCECTVTGSGSAFTPAYVVFENGSETIRDQRGTLITKTIAEPSNNQQPEECNLCCRDHIDVPGGYDIGNSQSILYGAVENSSPTGTYTDYCRLKFVDGILSVFQDWSLDTVTVMSDSYLSDSQPDTQTAYREYVPDFVLDIADDGIENSTTKPPLADSLTMGGRNITLGVGASKQLLVRGVYIDNVYNASGDSPSYATFISDKITNADADTLQYIPFNEVNLTKLANWETEADPDIVVTADAIVDESASEDNYSRGLVTAVPAAVAAASENVTASVNTDNSGIVGAASAGTPATDNIVATVDASIIYFSVSGQITFCAGLNGGEQNAVYAALQSAGINYGSNGGSGSCTINNKQGNVGSYSCDAIEDLGASTDAVISFPAAAFPSPTSSGPYDSAETSADVVICDS